MACKDLAKDSRGHQIIQCLEASPVEIVLMQLMRQQCVQCLDALSHDTVDNLGQSYGIYTASDDMMQHLESHQII
jgi:hypothetical protein